MDRTNFSKSLNPIGSGPTVSGYVSGVTEYIEGDLGADATTFVATAVIGGAWESVGPTGSGATNIWTALDLMQTGTKWVEIKFHNIILGAGTSSLVIYGRVTGSSTGIGVTSSLVTMTEGTSTATQWSTVSHKVPVDSSGRFDLYVTKTGASTVSTLMLVGWSA